MRAVPRLVPPPVGRLVRRLAAVTVVVAVAAVVSVTTSDPGPGGVQAAGVLGAGGEFHPLTPARVLDTRSGVNGPAGARPLEPGTGTSFEVPLSGQGGLPDMSSADEHDVLGVAISVTVVEPTEPGYLRAFGTGNDEGTSSIVNFGVGDTVPNMTILSPGEGGSLTVRLVSEGGSGTAHVLIDVFGWFSKGTYPEQGSRLIPVGPGRIFDSRQPVFGETPLGAGEAVRVPITGADSLNPVVDDIVPARDTVTGVVLNVTGINQGPDSEPTFVSVVPEEPTTAPSTSNLNLRADHVKANLVMTPVGADGSVWLYNSAGAAHLAVDVVAYLEPRDVDTREGRVIPLDNPFRVLDTRQPEYDELQLGPSQGEDWNMGCFVADVRIGTEWVGRQSAFIGNLTATGLTRRPDWNGPADTYMTVYPSAGREAPPPEASNINLAEGETVANAALIRYGELQVEGEEPQPFHFRVFNFNHFVHYLVDAAAVVLTDTDADVPVECPSS